MRFDNFFLALSLLGSAAASIVPGADIDSRDAQELYKRRGGGGGGGRGGGSSGGGGSRGGSGGSSGGSSGNRAPSSNAGGTSSGGSGTPRTYGGGRFYGGGATVPYTAGQRSRGGLIAGPLLLGSALAFWPGIWLYGAYTYRYRDEDNEDEDYEYNFFNSTTDRNETAAVVCACGQYSVCGCDQNEDTEAYLDELVGDGSYEGLDKSVITAAEINGTQTLLINGTLDNGTTADSPAGNSRMNMIEAMGYWPAVAAVGAAVFLA